MRGGLVRYKRNFEVIRRLCVLDGAALGEMGLIAVVGYKKHCCKIERVLVRGEIESLK